MTYRSIYLSFSLALLLFSACRTTYFASRTQVAYERISEAHIESDDEVNHLLAPYRQKMNAKMDKEIGYLDTILIKERPESSIGNWLADMLLEEAQRNSPDSIDFAVQNYGGIRVTSLASGPITIGDVYEVMPFDNMISILTADGRGVQEFMDHMAKGRGWPISRGIQYKIKNGKAIEVMSNGRVLEPYKTYRFAVPDYIAGGGSGSFFLKRHQRQDLNLLIRDAFITHIMRDTDQGFHQYASKEGRIINLTYE